MDWAELEINQARVTSTRNLEQNLFPTCRNIRNNAHPTLQQSLTEYKYSTARSGLLNAARSARTTVSRSQFPPPMSKICCTVVSNALPATRVEADCPYVALKKRDFPFSSGIGICSISMSEIHRNTSLSRAGQQLRKTLPRSSGSTRGWNRCLSWRCRSCRSLRRCWRWCHRHSCLFQQRTPPNKSRVLRL